MDHSLAKLTADKVAASILRAGRSKASVASAAGIPTSTFGRKIDGHVEFTLGELLRIARAVGVSPSEYVPAEFSASVPVAA
ncbi:helix-turn-helix domain-containing protein [Microbacterium sp. SL75]|uniref:helix-turn-helix domain-containing protein n=1 Tax=Microbacterium sp. SL75 TaxID=2995140 RepID=UPI0022704AFE|nr:helix-turn-helix transcriptional regulator [Microbacterium sp. SL75]WAC68868.1 helix-turn-helix transcriptional regulator [Microbacterium sp. SL75]